MQSCVFEGDAENDRCPISLCPVRDLAHPVGFDAMHAFECEHCRTAGRTAGRTASRAACRTNRWTFGPADGRRGYISTDIEAPRPWSLQPE
jgi:hypothetical protein